MIHGIIAVDKPLEWTSHDVVGRIRRVAEQRQVGHAGTLDPLASGVLIVLAGHATKLSKYVMQGDKTYDATVILGATTVTDDAEAPPEPVADATHLQLDEIEACIQHFQGAIAQVPPAYAAIKRGGEKLYVLARRGVAVKREPRQVKIYSIEVLEWKSPHLELRIKCGAGTYIRSLARDLGAELKVGGYLGALRRTRSGGFLEGDCVPLDQLQTYADLTQALLPIERAIEHMRPVALDSNGVSAIGHGQTVPMDGDWDGEVALFDGLGTLVALGVASGRVVQPHRVFVSEGDVHEDG